MALELLSDILIIFAIALIVGIIFNRIRVPPLVAFILTGVIVGPYGFSIIRGQDQVANLAEIGIILLLFTTLILILEIFLFATWAAFPRGDREAK